MSDQGTEFDNQLLKELSVKLGINKLRTSSYKPSTNGVAERVYRTLNTMMGKVISDHQQDWTDHLPKLLAAYRSAEHQSTGYSPNMLILGREVNVPLDLIIKTPSEETIHADTYVEHHLNQFREAYQIFGIIIFLVGVSTRMQSLSGCLVGFTKLIEMMLNVCICVNSFF